MCVPEQACCPSRYGRKEKGVTALAPEAQDFDLMYEQTKAVRDGKPIDKPIYNHVSGLLDPAETIKPPKVGADKSIPLFQNPGR